MRTKSTLLATLIATVALSGCNNDGHNQKASADLFNNSQVASSSAQSDDAVLLNGVSIIKQEELKPFLGEQKAVVIDQMVNESLMAQAAKKLSPEKSNAVTMAAERRALALLWQSEMMAKLSKEVSEDKIKAYYDERMKDEDYQNFKVKYYLTDDPVDAKNVAGAIAKNEKGVMDKLKKFNEGAYTPIQSIPYGLGRVVSGLKDGQSTEPVATREGYFVLYRESSNGGKKPELNDALKNEIRSVLAQEQLILAKDALRINSNIQIIGQ